MKKIVGKVEKIAKRAGFRLVIASTPKRAICDFDTTPETPGKLRQGDAVTISGEIESEGYESVVLSNCRLLVTEVA